MKTNDRMTRREKEDRMKTKENEKAAAVEPIVGRCIIRRKQTHEYANVISVLADRAGAITYTHIFWTRDRSKATDIPDGYTHVVGQGVIALSLKGRGIAGRG
jgi:hypothetical protein